MGSQGKTGNDLWFELPGVLSNRGFEKQGFHCNFRAEPCVNKSPPENLEYSPQFLGQIPKISQNSRKFNFVNSCLLENLPSPPNPRKVFRFLILRVDTPRKLR